MLSRTTFVTLAVGVLALTGCGGSNGTATKAAGSNLPLPPGVSLTPETRKPVTPATYDVNLAGFPKGSPNGSGLAVVSIEPSKGGLCWQFSQLKNVTAPTEARIFLNFSGASGRGGYLLGRPYKSSGCIQLEPAVLALIESKPYKFYVNIHDAHYPNGAVRGPLSTGGPE
jgi:hypothetical protein